MSSDDMNGSVALVTGGGRGLGRAFAQALAEEGAAVAVTARSEDQLRETVELIDKAGGRAVAIPADVSDERAVERAVSTTEQQLGPVDVLVNNAGVAGATGPTWEISFNEWKRVSEINLFGSFLCARAVLPGMIARRRGRIINLSSGASLRPLLYASAYGASKAALNYLTNCLAGETKAYGISVFAYAPGLVRTPALEAALSSAHESIREGLSRQVEEGRVTPIERSVEMFMFLASGRADSLSGRYIHVGNDEDDLLRRADEIQRDDLYTVRLRT